MAWGHAPYQWHWPNRAYPPGRLRVRGLARAGPRRGLNRHHLPCRNVVDRTNHLQLSSRHEIGQDRLRALERLDIESHVLSGGLGEKMGGVLRLGRDDGGPDR